MVETWWHEKIKLLLNKVSSLILIIEYIFLKMKHMLHYVIKGIKKEKKKSVCSAYHNILELIVMERKKYVANKIRNPVCFLWYKSNEIL